MRLLIVWLVRIFHLWFEILLTLPLGRLDLDPVNRFHYHVAAALRLITAMIEQVFVFHGWSALRHDQRCVDFLIAVDWLLLWL